MKVIFPLNFIITYNLPAYQPLWFLAANAKNYTGYIFCPKKQAQVFGLLKTSKINYIFKSYPTTFNILVTENLLLHILQGWASPMTSSITFHTQYIVHLFPFSMHPHGHYSDYFFPLILF